MSDWQHWLDENHQRWMDQTAGCVFNNSFKTEETEMAKTVIEARQGRVETELKHELKSDPKNRLSDDAIELLAHASKVLEARGEEYNTVNNRAGREQHMKQITEAFNVLTGQDLTIRQGWLFMVILKVARAANTDNLDTFIDMAAYAALAGEQRNA